ncbi:hypothetical protein PC117_g25422 [Phytophthora cactorum]|uniref:Uncharacterized protein n=1 Tax=Phytophthora cactorum TaxID=29920 RepID=A0A8T1ATB3_9STRA|nr:hypothetical protein PC117_g25422 [Phytophthora cactorum]
MTNSTLFPPNTSATTLSALWFNAKYTATIRLPGGQNGDLINIADEANFIRVSRLPNLTGHQRVLSDTLKVQKTLPASAADHRKAKYAAEVKLRRLRNHMHQARYKLKRKLVAGLND